MNIVMLVQDRPELTRQSIVTLLLNTEIPWNLTVVDDGSTRVTVELLRAFLENRRNARWITLHESSHVIGGLKNLGVYWSEKEFGRSDWLYISDNDVYFTPGWAEKLMSAAIVAERCGVRLMGGQNHPFHHARETVNGRGASAFAWREYESLAGTSWLMRWETWDRFGPLIENEPGVCKGEDHEFCMKIRNAGYEVAAIWPHVVLDTGITQTGGTPSPGANLKPRVPNVLYE